MTQSTCYDEIYSRTTYFRSGLHGESIGCHNFDQVGIDFSNFFLLWVVTIRFYNSCFKVSKDRFSCRPFRPVDSSGIYISTRIWWGEAALREN